MSLKGVQHHLVHLCDVACANSEDDIAMMSTHRHHLCRGMHILPSANPILGRRVVKLKRLVHNGGGANRRIVLLLFTCGENAGDDHIIRLGQCFSEFTRKEHGPGEQVRLEDHANHRLRVPAARRIQQCRNLRRMMRVIINDSHLADHTTHLETTGSSKERRGGLGSVLDIDAQQRGRNNRSGGIARVVNAWNGKRHRNHTLMFAQQSRGHV